MRALLAQLVMRSRNRRIAARERSGSSANAMRAESSNTKSSASGGRRAMSYDAATAQESARARKP
jgi:hypothetical protein